METEKTLVLQFRIGKKAVLYALAAMFLCWNPHFLGSETLTLTTYYPAPYGGYARLLTTGDTVLARDSGNVTWAPMVAGVKWGGVLSADQGGSIELGGPGQTPYLDFHRLNADFDARMIYTGANGGTLTMQAINDIAISPARYLWLNGGTLRMCGWVFYSYAGDIPAGVTTTCPMNTDGITRMIPVTMRGAALPQDWAPNDMTTSVHNFTAFGEDWSGWMLCCPIRTTF